MNNIIHLNFIELSEQDISFKIYRKRCNDKAENGDMYFYRLPNDSDSEWGHYLISLEKQEDFAEYDYEISINHHLSNHIFFDKLCNAFKENFDEYKVQYKDNFYKNIEIIVNEVSEGKQIVYLSPYFLRAEKKFGFLIDFKFEKSSDTPFNREVQRYSLSLDRNYRSNKNFYRDKYSFIDKVIGLIPSFKLNEYTIKLSSQLIQQTPKLLESKTYLFKNKNQSNSQFNGVKRFGPYMEIDSADKIQFYFVFTEKNRTLANDIFLSLKGKKSPGTFPGLKSMFNIQFGVDNVEKVPLSEYSLKEAENIISTIKSKIHENSLPPFVIYIEENNYDEEQVELYHFFKYKFLNENIPFQVVTNEKLKNSETLKWSISSIGLQIFSKLGGIPWLVKPSKKNCLILGIGQDYYYNEGKIKKQFAYSVCVDSSGLFKKVSLLSSEGERQEDFFNTIKSNMIDLLKNDDDLKGYKHCAIHIPFTISNKIISSIQEAAKELSSDIEIRIIKVNTKNKFFGYSNHLTKVPYESSYIKLGIREFLVWFEGLNYGKENVYKRTASPIHIKFLDKTNDNIDNELNYLQDVLNLSGSNWRGFNAKSMPISIYYSQLIANYSTEFQRIDGFDKDSFANQKPWFL